MKKKSPVKKILRIALLVIILAVFAITIVYLYNKSKDKPVVFVTEQPFVTDIIQKTVATGSVVPREEIEIKPTVSGIVERIYVEPGEKVKQGDVIAKVRIIPDLVNLNNAESRLERARITFEDARINFERQEKLVKSGVIAQSEFQTAQMTFLSAKQEMESAEANLDLVREGATKKSGATTNTLIASTINGMILDVPIKVGSSVIEANNFNPGTTIASIANVGDMIFQGKVDETEVGKIRPGMPLLLMIGAIENDTFEAVLQYIAPKGVLENGAVQFEIKADVRLKENQFVRAGYSANANIVLQRADQVMAIRESLLQFDDDSTFVEVLVAPDTYEKRMLKTGLSDGINVQVIEGLTKDDKIKVPQMAAAGH